MVIYVLDASAVMRFLDEEAGTDRVEAIFQERAKRGARVVISAVQWGEVTVVLCRRDLVVNVPRILRDLADSGVEVIAASPEQAVQAGILQRSLELPDADAFVVTLAQQLEPATLVTADYELLVAEHLAAIEFLPRTPRFVEAHL